MHSARVSAASQSIDGFPDAPVPRRGRPRKVTPEAAIEAAMRVFWKAGFQGASIDQLSRATGMPRATLYQSHGGKEGLFIDAVAHFRRTRMKTAMDALHGTGVLRHDLARFYEALIDMALSEPSAPGCLMASALSDAAGANMRLRQELDTQFNALEAALAARFEHVQEELHPHLTDSTTCPQAVILMAASVARGLMLRARAGADRPTLLAATRVAVEALCTDRDPRAAVR